MGKKLSRKEKREREINKVISKIKKLESNHPADIVESACAKYKNSQLARRNAERKIAEAQKALERAKRDLK